MRHTPRSSLVGASHLDPFERPSADVAERRPTAEIVATAATAAATTAVVGWRLVAAVVGRGGLLLLLLAGYVGYVRDDAVGGAGWDFAEDREVDVGQLFAER